MIQYFLMGSEEGIHRTVTSSLENRSTVLPTWLFLSAASNDCHSKSFPCLVFKCACSCWCLCQVYLHLGVYNKWPRLWLMKIYVSQKKHTVLYCFVFSFVFFIIASHVIFTVHNEIGI